MVTLPPIRYILHDVQLDDDPRTSCVSPSQHSHKSPEIYRMRNPLKLPRILGLDDGCNLPPLRDLYCDQLDKYRRSSHGASDNQAGDSARRAFRSPPSDRDSEAYGRGDDVDRWLESTSSSRSDDSRSSTPTHSLYSQVIQDADSDSVYPTAGSSGSGRSHTHSSHYQSHRHQQPPESQNQQVVHRSRWQSIILEAGGFGAAWSEESMRRLRYVLQWLQYATDHIDQQILAIRDFTESLQQNYFDPSTAEDSPTTPTNNKRSSANHTRSSSISVRGGHSRSESESESQAISSVHMHKLTSLRRDVVHTVREVVSVVSKYGGSAAMPEPARNAVKGFILKLPKKVGDAMRMGASSTDIPSAPVAPSGGVVGVSGPERDSVAFAASGRPGSDRRRRTRGDRGVGGSNSAAQSPSISRAPSPSNSPRISADPSISGMDEDQSSSGSGFRHGPPLHTMSAGSAAATAQRILTLATESLDMMRGMTAVVKDSLDRADAWVERLKRVGVQRGDGEPDASGSQLPPAPPASTSEHGRVNLTLSPNMMQYREQEQDVASLSPLSMTFNPSSRSRRGSAGSSTGYSLPSTPGYPGYLPGSNKYVPSHGPGAPVVDAPSPEMGLGLRRMSIRGDDAEEPVNIKKEEPEETKMEIDEPQ
jgi:hypothetical protein